MRLHFIPLSIIAVLPYISIVAAFSYIFNTAAQKCFTRVVAKQNIHSIISFLK